MYQELMAYNVDVVMCLVRKVDESDNILTVQKIPKRVVVDTEKIQKVLLNRPSACNKLFKRKVWEHIRFPEHLYLEDLATMYQLAPYINTMLLTDVVYFNYVKRSGSITNTCSPKHIQDMIQVYTTINRNLQYEFFSKTYIVNELIGMVLKTNSRQSYKKMIVPHLPSVKDILLLEKDKQKLYLGYKFLPFGLFRFCVSKGYITL